MNPEDGVGAMEGVVATEGHGQSVSTPADRLEFNPSSELSSEGVSGVGAIDPGRDPVPGGVAEPQGEWESVRDVAKSLGWQDNGQQFQDDRSFLLHLLNESNSKREADYYSQLGRQLAPHYQGIQQYLSGVGGGGAAHGGAGGQGSPTVASQRPEWEPPEFDQQWLRLVQQDPATGVYLPRPGVDPSIAQRVNEFDRWQQKYGQNPAAMTRAMIQAELPNLIQSHVQEAIGGYQRQQQVNQIVARNSEWMYQRGADGRTVIGVGGRPVATPEGVRYGQLVQSLESRGMTDPAAVDDLARNLLLGEMARAQLERGSQNQVPSGARNNALASGRSQANQLQSLPPQQRAASPGATEPDSTGMSLAEMMRRDLGAAGFSDQDFRDLSTMTS